MTLATVALLLFPMRILPPPAAIPDGFRDARFGEVRIALASTTSGEPAVTLWLDGGAADRVMPQPHDGVTTIRVSTKEYIARAALHAGRCFYPAADLEDLAQDAEKRLGWARYVHPIVAGDGAGATLAYQALESAPEGTFAGALSVAFSPKIVLGGTFCAGDGPRATRDEKSRVVTLTVSKTLSAPWLVVQGAADPAFGLEDARRFAREAPDAIVVDVPGATHDITAEEPWRRAVREAMTRLLAQSPSPSPSPYPYPYPYPSPSPSPTPYPYPSPNPSQRPYPYPSPSPIPIPSPSSNPSPSPSPSPTATETVTDAATDTDTDTVTVAVTVTATPIASPLTATATATAAVPADAPLSADLRDLPLHDVRPPRGAAVDDRVQILLSGDGGWAGIDRGVAAGFAGEGMRTIGWDSLAFFWKRKSPDDIAAALARIIESLPAETRIIATGFSFGADALPFAVNRLPEADRKRIAAVVLIAPSKEASFEIHPLDWLIDTSHSRDLPTAPELTKLDMPVVCLVPKGDKHSPAGAFPQFVVVQGKPGHHLGGDYAAVARSILAPLDRIVPPVAGH